MRLLFCTALFLTAAGMVLAESPLYWAIANNDAGEVWKLTSPEAAPGTLAETGQEPSVWAVQRGAGEVLQVLTWRGAPLDAVDSEGRNLLFPAASLGRLDLFERILAGGARLDQTDREGRTLVHAAAESPHPPMLSRVLAAGGQVQARSAGGITPLMAACLAGRAAEAEMLLRWGAIPEDEDYLGRSVREYAIRGGDADTLDRIDGALIPWTIGETGAVPLP